MQQCPPSPSAGVPFGKRGQWDDPTIATQKEQRVPAWSEIFVEILKRWVKWA